MQILIPTLVAVTLVVLGLSYGLQSARWIALTRHITAQPERIFPAAVIMVAAGTGIATGYDNWSGTWPLFVTLLGWLLALEGAVILLFPVVIEKFRGLSDGFLRWYLRTGGAVLVMLGALLWLECCRE
jgi:hypothetical protein